MVIPGRMNGVQSGHMIEEGGGSWRSGNTFFFGEADDWRSRFGKSGRRGGHDRVVVDMGEL